MADNDVKAKVYEDYHKKVFSYLRSHTNNADLAEDLCSDVFLKVYEKWDTFDETKASVSTWIFTITRNTLTDYFRTRKVQDEVPETLALDYSVEEEVENNEMLDVLADALKKLDERERDIIILHYYSGETLKEIAVKLGISYPYVKILHNKALGKMRGFLE